MTLIIGEEKKVDITTRARPAWETYQAVERPAWETYQAVERPAWEVLSGVSAVMADAARVYPTELSEIIGMLPCTFGALNEHANNSEWCNVWADMRDSAVKEGVLIPVEDPTVAAE
jgi:tryptophan-rich sensory protein